MTENNVHRDMLGKELAVGQFVATYLHNGLAVFKVERLTPKMVRVNRSRKAYTGHGTRDESVLRHGYDVVILDTEEVVLYQLTK
jgi:hypothetical protein